MTPQDEERAMEVENEYQEDELTENQTKKVMGCWISNVVSVSYEWKRAGTQWGEFADAKEKGNLGRLWIGVGT